MAVRRGTSKQMDLEDSSQAKSEKRWNGGVHRPALVLVVCFMTLPPLVFLTGPHRSPSLDWLHGLGRQVRLGGNSEEESYASTPAPKDRLLGGLLAPGFDEQSCLSRYEFAAYPKKSPQLPSPYLVARLRKYEALHKKCGPNTELYKKSAEQLKSNHSTTTECNYVVWSPIEGLGNRMITLTSTFLYALLTDRVLLVHKTGDMEDLLCEPFPETSWVLPSDFPIERIGSLGRDSPERYGSWITSKASHESSSVESLPQYMFLQLAHDYNVFDKRFFCDDDQKILSKIPWLVLKSDNYFVPGLFLMPAYEGELNQLFPAKDTVFHHLVRYLLHPTNSVWGMVTRYYEAYLAKADERVGIQIRTFSWAPISFESKVEQIITCVHKEKLLPNISHEKPVASASKAARPSKAVLVTSLNARYYEKLKAMYYEHEATTGEIIGVHQPSHEEHQHSDTQTHNQKALAEMYLLSFSDVLVTSAWSTFGYMAQGLGGLKPWFLLGPENGKVPEPFCRQVMSSEPCFHSPHDYDCKARGHVDSGTLVRHVRHCEDATQGLKMFD